MSVTFQLSDGGTPAVIDQHPDQCPICHSKIAPLKKYSKIGGVIYNAAIEIVYLCPNYSCRQFFIGYFDKTSLNDNYASLKAARPVEPAPLSFSDAIKGISENFSIIYEEAHKAEQFGLTQICGVGYRKALEFLIKDYLIRERPSEQAAIEATLLGHCIENYVTDPKTKQVAKRATWLGNDEPHYQRRWIGKDLHDLKTLISLVVHWIEAEYLTVEALKSMP